MKKPKPYNWKKVFKQLKKQGLRQTDVVNKTGINKALISKLARGINKSPTWETGQAILDLLEG